jgi:ankyrin repeat protein
LADKDGTTPLIVITRAAGVPIEGSPLLITNVVVPVMQLLIAANAGLDRVNRERESALSCATSVGNYDLVKLLLFAGAHPSGGGQAEPPLMFAAMMGRLDLAQILMSFGAT